MSWKKLETAKAQAELINFLSGKESPENIFGKNEYNRWREVKGGKSHSHSRKFKSSEGFF